MARVNIGHRLARLARFAVRHPIFAAAHLRGIAELKLVESRGGLLTDQYQASRITGSEFEDLGNIKHFLASDSLFAELGRLDADKKRFKDKNLTHPGGDSDLGRLCYALTRLLRPTTVVEIGVARGMTTTCALLAIEENGSGHMYSIDLPNYMADSAYVGSLIRTELKSRWTLLAGSSRWQLPKLKVRPELMIIDGLHSYQTMKYEYGAALEMVKPQGLIVCDDIECNLAFKELQCDPNVASSWVFQKTEGPGRFGIALLK